MLYRDICKILGTYLLGLAGTLALPLLLALYYQLFADVAAHPQPHTSGAFLWSIFWCLALAVLFLFIGRHATGQLYRREGIIVVVMIWFITPVISGLPFYFSGTLDRPLQALFEATSGFTTTGASTMYAKKYDPVSGEEVPIRREFCGANLTVYSFYGTIEPVRDGTGKIVHEGIEAVSKALLFWRAQTQWLGGMGIVVLFVAILPALGVGGKVLMQSEMPGPVKDSLTPRIKETASQLWKIYVALTVLQIGLMMMTNQDLDWLDAVATTFSTLSTGGFGVKNASIGAYDNAYTDWIVILFMVLGSINFSLYFHSLKGKFYRFYEPEFFLFLCLLMLGCLFATWFLLGQEKILMTGEHEGTFTWGEAFRYGSFQFVSFMSSTGFATADYDHWPYALQVVMVVAMFIGGMSGSTAGGMKVVRQYMVFRTVQYKVESLFRPEAVRRFKIGSWEVDGGVTLMVLCFFAVVIAIATLSTFFFVIDGMDLETAFTLVALLMNNCGMGFRMAAATESCAFLSDFGLTWSCLLMVFGRLEYFAILALLVPSFWKQDS